MFAGVLEARTINGQILAITVVEIVRRDVVSLEQPEYSIRTR